MMTPAAVGNQIPLAQQSISQKTNSDAAAILCRMGEGLGNGNWIGMPINSCGTSLRRRNHTKAIEESFVCGNLCYMPDRPEQREPIAEALRKAIADAIEAGESFRGIEQATGVLRQSLMKFARGETSLRLDLADRLAVYLGLEVKPPKPRKGK